MSEYRGIARWSNEAVGMINWNDQTNEGTAQVTDETTGTVYEIGGGGGGGGESDFSTAEVTVVNNPAGLTIPACVETPIEGSIASPPNADVITAILYKGHCYMSSAGIESVSGDIQYIEDYSLYDITGDCTITFQSIG